MASSLYDWYFYSCLGVQGLNLYTSAYLEWEKSRWSLYTSKCYIDLLNFVKFYMLNFLHRGGFIYKGYPYYVLTILGNTPD